MMRSISRFVSDYKEILLKGKIFFVHHIRDDFADFIHELVSSGVRIHGVIGPNYSAQNSAAEKITRIGVPCEVLNHNAISNQLLAMERDKFLNGVGLVDTGGYGAALANPDNLEFIVELTNRGFWNYQNAGFESVLLFATAANKALENMFVGRAVTRAVIMEAAHILNEKSKIGVIGFGGIGENVCVSFEQQKWDIRVNDRNSIKMILAHSKGFSTIGLDALLDECDVIIGCTGQDIFQNKKVKLKKRTLFFSASSRDVEFKGLNGQGNAVIENNGYPINLKYASLPIEVAEHLFVNILACAVESRLHKTIGIREMSSEWQEKANLYWSYEYEIDYLKSLIF